MFIETHGVRLLPVGDMALCAEFGSEIDPAINQRVVTLDRALMVSDIPGIIETVPSYRALLIIYEPAEITWDVLQSRIRALIAEAGPPTPLQSRRWTIPVCYEPPHGEDVAEVATLLGLSEDRVVADHVSVDFRVYMLGFQPAMPYLGGLPPSLHLSRRVHLRPPVPSQAVAIAGVQSAIMPFPTLTGWYLLGRTPVRPFDPRRDSLALFSPGDIIRFYPIGAADYARLDQAVAEGELLAGAGLDLVG